MAGEWHFNIRPKTTDRSVLRENVEKRQYFRTRLPERDDIWLDGGAHIGAFAITTAREVEAVIACEPEPDNYALLWENTLANQAYNVLPLRVALTGDTDPTAQLWLAREARTPSEHSLVVKRNRTSIEVPARNINQVFETAHGINCLKLDVEGAEYTIFRALEPRWLEQLRAIAMEAHIWVSKGKPAYDELLALLRQEFAFVEAPEVSGNTPTVMVYAQRSAPRTP